MSAANCEICADAYGTRYVCATCRADPANASWSTSRDGSDVAAPDELPKRRAEVVVALFRARVGLSRESHAQIAIRLGLSRGRVTQIHSELLSVKFYRFKSVREQCASETREKVSSGRLSMRAQEEALIKAAWFEWRTNSDEPADDFDPPRWFVLDELGYRGGSDVTLTQTCEMLAKKNAAAMCTLDEPHMRVTYPRDLYTRPDWHAQAATDSDESGARVASRGNLFSEE